MMSLGVLASAQVAATSDIFDSFEIPNVDPWDGTGTDLTWTLQGAWNIAFEAARPDTGNNDYALAAVTTPLASDNCWAETTQTFVFTNTIVGPAVHLSAGSGYMFGFRSSGLSYMYRIESDVIVPVASANTTAGTLRLESSGDTLRGYKDGTLVIEWTDPSPLPKTRNVGMGGFNTNNASRIDTFTAGVL